MMIKKNNKGTYGHYLILTLLLASTVLNGYLLYRLDYVGKTNRLSESLGKIRYLMYAVNNCDLQNRYKDNELASEIKGMPGISNAVVEQSEGKKSLYVSYQPYGKGANWADERYFLNQCN